MTLHNSSGHFSPFEEMRSQNLPLAVQADAVSVSEHSLGSIRDLVSDVGHGNPDRLRAVENSIHELAQIISSLPYNAYLLLVDLLHRLRENRCLSFEENAKIVLEKYRGDNALVAPGAASSGFQRAIELLLQLQFQPGFRDDALIMTRATYPFGKNAVNKTHDPAMRIALDTSEDHTISNGAVSYQVSAAKEDGSVRIALGHREFVLHEGEAAILGRDLQIQTLFGVPVNGDRGVFIPSRLAPSGSKGGSVSRAGMLLLLREGQLYVFDRGSRQAVNIVSRNEVTVFKPDQRGSDGTLGSSCSMSMKEYQKMLGQEESSSSAA